jgi:cytochrome c-type biogenesis protein CcmH
MRWCLLVVLLACRETPKPEGQAAPTGLPPSTGAPAAPALPPSHPPIDPHQRMPEPQNVDPNMVLEGTIDIAPALKDKVKPGDVIFLSARRVEGGQIQRMPLAVDRLEVKSFPLPFTLSGANVMMAGTEFKGEVALSARLDRDQEATTRSPGDIEGTLRASIPAKGLKVVLDTEVDVKKR